MSKSSNRAMKLAATMAAFMGVSVNDLLPRNLKVSSKVVKPRDCLEPTCRNKTTHAQPFCSAECKRAWDFANPGNGRYSLFHWNKPSPYCVALGNWTIRVQPLFHWQNAKIPIEHGKQFLLTSPDGLSHVEEFDNVIDAKRKAEYLLMHDDRYREELLKLCSIQPAPMGVAHVSATS